MIRIHPHQPEENLILGTHISPTPRDETDMRQHVSLKSDDMHDQIDTRQPFDSPF
jgi:hypothetical protein